ncbi:nijmegen breakage syndrome 1 protein [Ipomoea triloba]|uniref:nijmegen breakage syndrome 1 protein n=1 Tax=Ipomoea triloba TaxID=35885 RepID=UPI00125CDC06|nr:nijmegen breakage syndrome 1 protein [Ipomoea triloba]
MVWGLFPIDPIPGEDKYYFFNKGTYKVGRKGCDVIVKKDKGVSRVHAEIVIEEMIYLEHPQKSSDVASKVRIRDCSKYGTFINKNLTSKEKVHECPNKEAMLKDGDLVSFGTGTATYRFSFVPLVFFICSSDNSIASRLLVKNISSIGAGVTRKWSSFCSHVLVEDNIPLKEGLVDAIVARKPFVQFSWVELIAGKNICTEIPSCDSHAPTLKLEGISVKVAVPEARGICLKTYTFILDLVDKYKLKDGLPSLLEVSGAKVSSVEDFCPNSQGTEEEENEKMVYVIPAGSTSSQCFHGPSLSRVNEMDLVAAAVSGHLDPSLVVSPPVLVTSSCSTDETVVADSDAETESGAESGHDTAPVCLLESADQDDKEKTVIDVVESTENKKKSESSMLFVKSMEDDHMRDINFATSKSTKHVDDKEIPDKNSSLIKPEGGCSMMVGVKTDIEMSKRSEIDLKSGNSDIIFSQELIIRERNLPTLVNSSTNGVANFKRFRKRTAPSGNSFNSLIPFSNDPYKESDYDNEEVVESIKEERRRKQMEARAEDLFNDEKKKKRGVMGSLLGVFARG